jgi:hypothetical protein
MAKDRNDLPELTDEELAFEMIEITCEEMDSLSRAFTMMAEMCRELREEVSAEAALSDAAADESIPADLKVH